MDPLFTSLMNFQELIHRLQKAIQSERARFRTSTHPMVINLDTSDTESVAFSRSPLELSDEVHTEVQQSRGE